MPALTPCQILGVDELEGALAALNGTAASVAVLTDALAATAWASTHVDVHIVAGCPCCVGQLPFQVQLNRLVRQRLPHLIIAVRAPSHREALVSALSAPPYDAWLKIIE